MAAVREHFMDYQPGENSWEGVRGSGSVGKQVWGDLPEMRGK